MELSVVGEQFGKIMLYGFGSGFTVGLVILSISSVVHKITSFYKQG